MTTKPGKALVHVPNTKVLVNATKRRPPNAGIGRKKGVPNKLTASIKAAFSEAFTELGGAQALVKWGKKHPTEFYKLAARLIPVEVTGNEGGPIDHTLTVTFVAVARPEP